MSLGVHPQSAMYRCDGERAAVSGGISRTACPTPWSGSGTRATDMGGRPSG